MFPQESRMNVPLHAQKTPMIPFIIGVFYIDFS